MVQTNPYDAPKSETAQTQEGGAAQRGGWIKIGIVLAVLIGLFVASRFLPINAYLGAFLEYVKSLGVWGPVLLAAVYVVATVLMVPGSILTLGAGFTFGLVTGTITAMAGSVLGALASFLVGRTVARGFVEQKAKENPRFAALDEAVEKEGFKIVLLTRLSPIFPFNLLNYLFSITKVRFRDYFLASWLGMIPGTIMYVYIGYAAKDLTEIISGDVEGGIGKKILLGVGLLATVAVTVFITRIARRALKDSVPEVKSPSGEGDHR